MSAAAISRFRAATIRRATSPVSASVPAGGASCRRGASLSGMDLKKPSEDCGAHSTRGIRLISPSLNLARLPVTATRTRIIYVPQIRKGARPMSTRSVITSQFQQVAREQDRTLAPLSDDLKLMQSGLDSLSFAIVVARLEDALGVDPFSAADA